MRLRLTKRFSVLSMMVLVAVVAIVFGCIVKPFRDQNRAAAELIARGYHLRMEPSWLSHLTRRRSFDRVVMAFQSPKTGPITAADVQSMNTLPYLEGLTLDDATDDRLSCPAPAYPASALRIWSGNCTEPGLIRLLESLTDLRSLDIRMYFRSTTTARRPGTCHAGEASPVPEPGLRRAPQCQRRGTGVSGWNDRIRRAGSFPYADQQCRP